MDFISYRDDAHGDDAEKLAERVRRRQTNDQRNIPVIAFVYGGGPGTLHTILEHIRSNDPILLFKGSKRAADLICDWKAFAKDQNPENDSDSERVSAARKWVLTTDPKFHNHLPRTAAEEAVLRKAVIALSARLDTIIAFEQLHIFDFFETKTNTAQSQAGKIQGNNELLPVVLRAIMTSTSVAAQIKLPLAVRYKEKHLLKSILRVQGIQVGLHDDLTQDTRPLVFAAFLAQDQTVKDLLNAGCDIQALDHLILAEFCSMAQARKVKHSTSFESPQSWKVEQVKKHLHAVHRAEWLELEPHEQIALLKHEWDDLPLVERQSAAIDDIQTISWSKMQYLPGWMYRVIGRYKLEANDSIGAVKASAVTFSQGAVFRHVGIARHKGARAAGGPVFDVVHVHNAVGRFTCTDSHEHVNKRHVAQVIPAAEAKQIVSSIYDKSSDEVSPDDEESIWAYIEDDQGVRHLLQQRIADETTRCLELDAPSRWTTGKLNEVMQKAADSALEPWIPAGAFEIGAKWWHHWDDRCEYSWLSSPLHPLMRLYWVRSFEFISG